MVPSALVLSFLSDAKYRARREKTYQMPTWQTRQQQASLQLAYIDLAQPLFNGRGNVILSQ